MCVCVCGLTPYIILQWAVKKSWNVVHCNNGRIYGNAYPIIFTVELLCTHTHTHTCSIGPATVGSAGRRLLLESSWARPSHSIWCPPRLRNVSSRGPFAEQGTAQSHWERDQEISVAGWWQQAMCGSVRYRDAETTVPACHLSRRFLCKPCM
jgi:hypothetical protein